MISFSQNLRSWRLCRGWTQEELARRSGVSRPNLVALERGQRECTLTTLYRLAASFEISPGVLLDQAPPEIALKPLSRHEVDEVARSLLTGGLDLSQPLLEVRNATIHEGQSLLRLAGVKVKARGRRRRESQQGEEVQRVLARLTRLLPHVLSGGSLEKR